LSAVSRQIVERMLLVLVVALAALGALASAASADLPPHWTQVAESQDPSNRFMVRPGQIIAGPGDGADVARVLGTGWRTVDGPFALTVFNKTSAPSGDPVKELQAALERIRSKTAGRPQGPATVAPNYVFVGEAVPATAEAINFMGEPRIQGGPGSSVRLATAPKYLPQRTTDRRMRVSRMPWPVRPPLRHCRARRSGCAAAASRPRPWPAWRP